MGRNRVRTGAVGGADVPSFVGMSGHGARTVVVGVGGESGVLVVRAPDAVGWRAVAPCVFTWGYLVAWPAMRVWYD
jgi:hypothetical protein